MHCLQCFTEQRILNNHKEKCLVLNNDTQKIECKEGKIKFNNYQNLIPVPFKIYGDIECFNKNIDVQKGKHTKLYQEHIPNSIAAKLVCIDKKYNSPIIIFEGQDCIEKFLEWVIEQYKKCYEIKTTKFNKILKMTPEDEENHKNSNKYWISTEEIADNKDKVRDHCHITGKYRGAAHRECNSKLRMPMKLPVFFHNLKGYDGRIIFKELRKFNIDVNPIPRSTEKYMVFNINIIKK